MFEPVRGGTRGGQAEFKWSDVSADKDRENYLGHSVNAPTGRWQKNKDIHWYSRDLKQAEAERLEEIRKIKEAEAEALAAALGFAPGSKPDASTVTGAPATGSNAVVVPLSETSDPLRISEKEEKRRKKAERKEEKRAKKEKRRAERTKDEEERRRHIDRSRSRSPRRDRSRERRRSPGYGRSPDRHSRREKSRSWTPPARRDMRSSATYGASEREKEREWDRRRWDESARREQAGAKWGRD